MPTMYEIYQNHADRYHELVSAEDYEGNLSKALHELLDWFGLSVIEARTGTGRVTQLYIEQVAQAICYDREAHMLDFAKTVLAPYGDSDQTSPVCPKSNIHNFDSASQPSGKVTN